MARLKRVAREEGLPLGERRMTFNSRLAQELGKWAESLGQGEPFHRAIFHAYFAEASNIAREDELCRIAESVGLAAEEAARILAQRTFRAAVDEDWALSRRRGVTAVPTFFLNGRSLVGAQPYEMLSRFVEAGGVPRRTRS